MMRKLFALNKLLNWGTFGKSDKQSGIGWEILGFSLLGTVYVSPLFCLGFLTAWVQKDVINSYRTRLIKSMPISEKFAVGNVFFFIPAIVWGIMILVCGAFLFGMSIIFQSSGEWIKEWSGIQIDWIMITIYVLILFIVCSLTSMISFTMDDLRKQTFGRSMVYLCLVGCIWAFRACVKKAIGATWEISISDMVSYVGELRVLVILLIAALIITPIAFVRSLKAYNGMAMQKEFQRKVGEGKVMPAAGLILIIAITMGVSIAVVVLLFKGLFGETEYTNYLDYEAKDSVAYEEWGRLNDTMNLPASVFSEVVDTKLLLFPENTETGNIKDYYAKVNGEIGYDMEENNKDWTSLESDLQCARCAQITYDESAYEKEKLRISRMTNTIEDDFKEKTYQVQPLKDTTHFDGEAYIAQWDTGFERYEVAIFDDAAKQVTYLYVYDMPFDSLPKPYQLDLNPEKVVKLTDKNTKDGYSMRGL